MKELCCISMGRTGSNYLCDLLCNVENLLTLREIFSYDKCYMPDDTYKKVLEKINPSLHDYEKIKQEMGINEEELKRFENKLGDFDIFLILFAHHHIVRFMSILREIAVETNKECLFYKIFPNSEQLTKEKMEKFFYNYDNVNIIYLTRNPLHMYVSFIKAQWINKWNKIDTSNIKIVFGEKQFMNYLQKYNQTRANVEEMCKKYNKKLLVMTYEEIVSHKEDDKRLEFVVNKINEAFDVNLKINPNSLNSSFFKQDKSNLEYSIRNYSQMVSFLKENNLDYLLE